MLRRALAASTLFCFVLCGSAASADESGDEKVEPDFAHNGTYLQAGGTNAIEVFRDLGPLSAESADAQGFNLRWGRRSNERIAIEGQFEWLNDFVLSGPGGGSGSFDTVALSVNAKVFALTGRVQPYALLGMGTLITSGPATSEVGFMGRLGAGVDVWVTEALAISLEAGYVLPSGRTRNFDHVAVAWSFVYRFASEEEDY